MRRAAVDRIGLTIALLCLGACASTNPKPTPAAEPAAVVASFNQVSYQQPQLGKTIDLDFDDRTVRYNDGHSDRLVQGVKLPASGVDLVVKVVTKRQGSLEEPAIFYPEVRVLDAAFQVAKVLPHGNYVYRSGGKAFLEGTFFLKGPSGNEHYLIVTNRDIADADLKVAQTNVTESHMIAPGFAFWMVHTGTSTPPTKMIADSEGEVEITISEYVLRTIDQKN